MITALLSASLMLVTLQSSAAALDPAAVREVDAIDCHLNVQTYGSFAFALEGEEQLARQRGWKKLPSVNPLLLEFELPAPITVAGTYSTRRIAFTADGILAVLDLADPQTIAGPETIANTMDAEPMIAALTATGKVTRAQAEAMVPFRKFLGERVVRDVTEPAPEPGGYGSRSVVARTISNVATHKGKTFYGCAYRLEILDENGAPL